MRKIFANASQEVMAKVFFDAILVRFLKFPTGGDLASTWVLKQREQTGAHVDLVKNVHKLVANNNYALAA